MNCDMHIHTTFSDGTLNEINILEECKRRNLSYLSITDHDCVDFYLNKNAINIIKEYKFNIVSGCEFICRVGGQPIEILGYGIDIKKAKEYLQFNGITQNTLNKIRLEHIPAIFNKFNIELKLKSLNPINNNILNNIFDAIKENAEAIKLINAENPDLLTSTNNFIRKGTNNPKSIFYIPPELIYPSYKKIIDLIHNIGGIASLAHPFQYGDNMDYVINKVVQAEIDGIECYHFSTVDNLNKDFTKRDYLIKLCKQHNLICTGGSDFHYLDKYPKNQLNELNIPLDVYNDIIKAIKEKNGLSQAV